MSKRGQVVVIVAFLIPVVLLLMAVGVDMGRIYLARAELQRAAESAASAGISTVADRMVTQVVFRKTEAAAQATAAPPGATATPEPGNLTGWLTDEDRATLVAPGVASVAGDAARSLLAENGVDAGSEIKVELTYPQPGYDPGDTGIPDLIYRVGLETRLTILLAGLLSDGWTEIGVFGEAAIPQR